MFKTMTAAAILLAAIATTASAQSRWNDGGGLSSLPSVLPYAPGDTDYQRRQDMWNQQQEADRLQRQLEHGVPNYRYVPVPPAYVPR
jgi:hypothetical protein